ncbi:GNAT family N-acetyltransferase [Flagellimonas sp. S3867]|uniref:GNAT family N-acetyltransferase n=1 Tax=Flagellimonas sp. S3867 TaxID=2768063 RepID=UPI0016845ED9|nr:GNAT family N-acetyltransferase [Flagellimonas sp. S3867]
MSKEIILEPVNPSTISTYISVGKKSYNQHYLHLWEGENSNPYINTSFTVSVLEKELMDPNSINFLVKVESHTIGIVKLVKNAKLDEHPAKKALLAEKIYLLKEFSGRGFGKKVLSEIETYAKSLDKQVLWLDTMQKGGPIHFYQKNGFTIKKESELSLPGAKTAEKAMWVLTKQL